MLSQGGTGGNQPELGKRRAAAALPLLLVIIAVLLSPFLYDLWHMV